MVETAGRIDRQRRRLLVVKRAHGHHRPSRTLDLGHLGRQLGEIGSIADLVDVVTRIRHQESVPSGSAMTRGGAHRSIAAGERPDPNRRCGVDLLPGGHSALRRPG